LRFSSRAKQVYSACAASFDRAAKKLLAHFSAELKSGRSTKACAACGHD
jgi:hypothetical protein